MESSQQSGTFRVLGRRVKSLSFNPKSRWYFSYSDLIHVEIKKIFLAHWLSMLISHMFRLCSDLVCLNYAKLFQRLPGLAANTPV